ncbi:hypothetical protein EAE96_011004 [Botrytis aclada]|nr:hypothetical protein EAE96_011004 [Botrytis aclada]
MPKIKTVLKLWIFADRIEIQKLQNYCMDFIRDYYLRNAKFMDLEELKYVFAVTGGVDEEFNLLRKFCVCQLHFQNNNADSSAVAYFLRIVPSAIGAYLDYETCCTIDNQHDPRNYERFPCEFHVHTTKNDQRACQL